MMVRVMIACAALLLALAGCGGGNKIVGGPAGSVKMQVTATIFPIADWLHEVGGDDIEVHCLVSGANNPHHFEPTPNDAVVIGKSRALFAAGLGLDPWAATMVKNSEKGSALAFFETGSWITPRKFGTTTLIGKAHDDHDDHDHDGDQHEHDHDKDHGEEAHAHSHDAGGADPHFWHDPQRAISVVKRLAAELALLDPAHKDAYARRADEYVKKLVALDEDVKKTATLLPAGSALVTFHDAYGYLFERLNVKLAAVIQVTPGVEPSLKDVAEAVRVMKEIGQTTVFKEPQESDTAARRVAEELKAKVDVLDPMDSETSSAGRTYIERFRSNLQRVNTALSKESAK